MTKKLKKLEAVLEFLVNGEQEKANQLLHEHLLETARDIYSDLVEEDELAEEELEIDLDESLDDSDKSEDFIDDIKTIDDEIETEEYVGEDDEGEEAEAEDDLEGEMDLDTGDEADLETGDMDVDLDSGGDDNLGDMEDAINNLEVSVEDSMAELKAVFDDMMGTSDSDEMAGDEVEDEYGDIDLGGDEEGGVDMDAEGEDEMVESRVERRRRIREAAERERRRRIREAAALKKYSVTMSGDEDGKSSPVAKSPKDTGGSGPVNFAGGADEKGGKATSPKKMKVTGPQDQKGKMDKKVSAPANKSEKAKSVIGKRLSKS